MSISPQGSSPLKGLTPLKIGDYEIELRTRQHNQGGGIFGGISKTPNQETRMTPTS